MKLSFVHNFDGFGQRVFVAVALAADRRLDTSLWQSFGIADRYSVLHHEPRLS